MKLNLSKTLFLAVLAMTTAACRNNVRPAIVPGVEVKAPAAQPQATPQIKTNSKIIGAIEPVYFPPMKTPFYARIDTGAATSSIDVSNLEQFERDGEKWVSFDLTNRRNNETHHFEKKIHRQIAIKRYEENERRIVVLMKVKFGGEIINAQFSLAERDKFANQGLIGRNILTGRAIVDTSISHTLK